MTAPLAEFDGAKELAVHSSANEERGDCSLRQRIPGSIGSPIHIPTLVFHPPRAS
jgi:hypothetical protein